jgi:hypothetical protein
MQQWFTKTIDKYTRQIILLCVFFLFMFALFNFFTRKKGSYTNYDETIKTLFELPFTPRKSSAESHKVAWGLESTNSSKGEQECKRVIEEITQKHFIKHRPDFLKNEITGKNLELDCYNDELKLAIEYNGIQHYEYTPVFHKNKDSFYNTKYRDKMKETLCHENGVKLIVVPYTVKLQDIKRYIQDRL